MNDELSKVISRKVEIPRADRGIKARIATLKPRLMKAFAVFSATP